MKVLQINSFFTVGGPPRIVNGIYDTLIEEGHECKIATARERMYVPKDSIQIGSNLGVKINALKARIFDNEGFNAKRATKKLIKEIEAYNPDIIHLHNLHGYYINIRILFDYLKRSNKPVVWTLHDCWALTGHCAHFDYVGCDKWKTGCHNCPQIKEYPKSLFADNSKKNYLKKKDSFTGVKNLTIVTPSQWLAELVKQSFLGNNQVVTIRNGIDIAAFSYKESILKAEYKINNKKLILGVAQNWEERKGLEDFAKLPDLLGDDYAIVLIGLTEAQKEKLPSSIVKLSRTENLGTLVEWYSCADVFVNLTYQDTFPTVNLEAQACGTPVITYMTGGSPESVPENYRVRQGDLLGVVSKIKEVCESEHKDRQVNSVGSFNRSLLYLEYLDLYKTLCEKKKDS